MDSAAQEKTLDFARAMELNIKRKFKGTHVTASSGCDASRESKSNDELGSAFDSLRINRDASNGSTCSVEDDSMEPLQRLRTISRLEQDMYAFIHNSSSGNDSKDEKSTLIDEPTSKSITLAFNLPLTMEKYERSSLSDASSTVTAYLREPAVAADEKTSSSSSTRMHASDAPATSLSSLKINADAKIFDHAAMGGLELASPSLASTSSVRKLSLTGPGKMKRRNSTGTLYIDHTMRMQDDKATIRCLCSVIRAHMLEVVENRMPYPREYSAFLDREYKHLSARDSEDNSDSNSRRSNSSSIELSLESDGKILGTVEDFSKVPSLEDVIRTFSYIFERSQMESECIIITLIYLERIKLATNGKLSIRYENWKSVLLSCIMMASKVWDDLSMLNVDFSKICPSFALKIVNKLETKLLEILMYEVRVSASCYAKYYFHLRSIMRMLGFITNERVDQQPLDVNAANRLQLSPNADSGEKSTEVRRAINRMHRCHSIAVDDAPGGRDLLGPSLNTATTRLRRQRSLDFPSYNGPLVQLEQLVSNFHTDADGLEHVSIPAPEKENITRTKHANSRYGRRRTYHW